MPAPEICGQLNEAERLFLTRAILEAPKKPGTVVEVGTWLGGGSTLHILRALERNGTGHLWGIEADRSIYDQMISNLRNGAPEAAKRFTPLFGFSDDVLRQWKRERAPGVTVDFVFLDGGNNPLEQIQEFQLLDPLIPEGGQLMAHDARVRKGKWLVPFLSRLDNWETRLHDLSEVGLLHGRKIRARPSARSLRAAKTHLLRQRTNPVEIAATMLPSNVCGFFLGLLPRRFAERLAHGR